MRTRGVAGLVVTVVALAAGLVPGAGAAAADGEVIAGSYIVTVHDGVAPDAVAGDHGRRLGAAVSHVYRHSARGYAGRMSASAARAAARDGRVRAVVADRVVQISAPKGGGGSTPAVEAPTGVRRVYGGAAVGAGVPVAVIDTGIDLSHPDLVVASTGVNCSSGTSYSDGNGHGTHVAGTIGARADGRGVLGVAPGTVMHPVRVLNNAGSGSWSSIICGIDWVTARVATIKVANMSLGGTGTEGSCTDGGLREAICRSVAAGVTHVVAAGNESDNAANHVPAAYDEVITVSALADSNGAPGGTWAATCRTDQEETLADFSNFGADVDLIAPGVCINSTWKGGGYKTISGTSMASPHVAAGAALYLARHAESTPAQVKAGLQLAGTLDWAGDADGFKEPLLKVDTL
ncbi:MAG TPA: S8 family serine peptidase [Acidimicrobiales bacterium]|nr:S8 family serine peptidase [Acidimicrobiales bacterium]